MNERVCHKLQLDDADVCKADLRYAERADASRYNDGLAMQNAPDAQ